MTTREEWLTAAVEALSPIFHEIGERVPPVRVSVGWPGGRSKKATTIGQCWKSIASADGVPQLFISPVLDDGTRVLDVLVHELIHAIDDCESGHKGRFVAIARRVGLEAPWTATTAGPALAETLAGVSAELGEYPHAALTPALAGIKKQTTRMLKLECPTSGYVVRTTRKWLDEWGAPICPCCDERMTEGGV